MRAELDYCESKPCFDLPFSVRFTFQEVLLPGFGSVCLFFGESLLASKTFFLQLLFLCMQQLSFFVQKCREAALSINKLRNNVLNSFTSTGV